MLCLGTLRFLFIDKSLIVLGKVLFRLWLQLPLDSVAIAYITNVWCMVITYQAEYRIVSVTKTESQWELRNATQMK